MKNYLRILSIIIIFVNASNAYSSENNCPISKEELYSRFREYRNLLNHEYARYNQLASYYLNSDNKKYINAIKASGNESEFFRHMDNYDAILKSGKAVRVVYGYSINCLNKNNTQLILNAYTYMSLTPWKKRHTRPSKVTINYTNEGGSWKMVNYIITNRKKETDKLSTNTIINDFR